MVSIRRRVRRPQALRYRSVSISRSTGTLSHLHVSCLAHRALLTRPDSSVICSYLHIVAFGDCRVTLPCCTALLGIHDKRCCSYGIYSISTTYDGALKSCDHNFNLRRCLTSPCLCVSAAVSHSDTSLQVCTLARFYCDLRCFSVRLPPLESGVRCGLLLLLRVLNVCWHHSSAIRSTVENDIEPVCQVCVVVCRLVGVRAPFILPV